jgi:hypothetical protein
MPSLPISETSCWASRFVIFLLDLISESQGYERGLKVIYSGKAREGLMGWSIFWLAARLLVIERS